MTSLLTRVAPPCSAAAIAEVDLEELGEVCVSAHPALTLAATLAVTGIGMVGAVLAATAAVAVPLYVLAGLL